METREQYLKNADECDRLASQIPAHAASLRKIAEAWRALASEAERKEKSGRDRKDGPDGSMHM